MPTLVRRESSLAPFGDPTLDAYASAVALMQKREAKDPTSWSYQAAMHGTTVEPPLPLWNGCQHGSWLFVAWHRMYIYYFEQIVRAAVVATGGPAEWTLPYWHYGLNGDYARLPAAFREPKKPNGEANPLYVPERSPRINAGERLPARVTSAAIALARPQFTGTAEFGGAPTSTGTMWNGTGRLEQTPHNDVHNLVGGWMSDTQTAAQDPIFWLHHSNIDRLWAVWNGLGRLDPGDKPWVGQKFEFFDATGTRVSRTIGEVLDTVADLGYTYDKLQPDPPTQPAPPPPIAAKEQQP